MPPGNDRVLGLHRLTWLAVAVQGAIALIAVGWAAWFGLEPLRWFPADAWIGPQALVAVAATLAAAAPPVAAFFWMRSSQAAAVVRFRDDVRTRLIPLFGETTLVDWLVISLTAGFTEEVAFRGALFDTLRVSLPAPWGLVAAIVVPSAIFGALHALNRAYFLATTAAGIYFSLVVLATGDLWAASLAHFLYDLTVFVVEAPDARRDLARMEATDSRIDPRIESPTEAAETASAQNEATAVAPTEGDAHAN